MTAEEFRALRIRRHIPQQKLGEMLGYKGKTALTIIQKWEYGKLPIPMKHFRKLADILEVPLEVFIPKGGMPVSQEEENFNATLDLMKTVWEDTRATKTPKSIILNNFERTLQNCLFYEQEGNKTELLNEIGCLRGLAYALEAFGECPHSDEFVRLIQLQQDLK